MSIVEDLFVAVAGSDPVVQGLVAGVVIATMNFVGALLVFVWRDPSQRSMDAALGGAAGVMLAAAFTSLILPGIEAEPHGGIVPVIVGIVLGVAVLDRADAWVPHVHVLITGRVRDDSAPGGSIENGGSVAREAGLQPDASAPAGDSGVANDGTTGAASDAANGTDAGTSTDAADDTDAAAGSSAASTTAAGSQASASSGGVDEARVASVLLFIVAITLHNMPEGLAVGVGFGSGNLDDAIALMIAIGIQNVPEGLAVSVAAINAGFGRRFYAAFTGLRAGLVEIPLALFGAVAVSVAAPSLPYAMGFAAGAMLYVISDEIIPETHANGNERMATLGTMAGLVVMLYLDVVLAA